MTRATSITIAGCFAAVLGGAGVWLGARFDPVRPEAKEAGAAVRPATPVGGGLLLVDVAREAGVTLRNVCGTPEKRFIIEANGSGAALLDYDLDGDLDIFIVNGSTVAALRGREDPPRDALYRNEGGWSFTDVTDEAGVGGRSWGSGCAVGDIENDGDPDLYVTNFGPNSLYENQGDGTLREVAAERYVADPGWGESAAFGDIDNDGDLDLYVTNNVLFDIDDPPFGGEWCRAHGLLVHCGPHGLVPQADRLFGNDGLGHFEDVSEQSGIRDVPPSFGLGVAFGDYDDDGWVDICVANDGVPNFLFHNLGGGKFLDAGWTAGIAANGRGESQSGMGIDIGDFDGDGYSDIIVTNFSSEYNTLYRNLGGESFRDVTNKCGLRTATWTRLGWGTMFFDADNDGSLDLYFANGHLYPGVEQTWTGTSYRQADQLFINEGEGSFREESHRIRLDGPARSSRGAAFGDIDNDGDIDILVVEIDDPPTVLRNDGGNRGRWLRVRLVGTRTNREGAGVRIWVTAGGKVQRKEATRSGSYCSSSDPRVHFGLGGAEIVEKIVVKWPSGCEQAFENVLPDREVTIHEDKGIQ